MSPIVGTMFSSLLDPQIASEMRSLRAPLRWLGMLLALLAGAAGRVTGGTR